MSDKVENAFIGVMLSAVEGLALMVKIGAEALRDLKPAMEMSGDENIRKMWDMVMSGGLGDAAWALANARDCLQEVRPRPCEAKNSGSATDIQAADDSPQWYALFAKWAVEYKDKGFELEDIKEDIEPLLVERCHVRDRWLLQVSKKLVAWGNLTGHVVAKIPERRGSNGKTYENTRMFIDPPKDIKIHTIDGRRTTLVYLTDAAKEAAQKELDDALMDFMLDKKDRGVITNSDIKAGIGEGICGKYSLTIIKRRILTLCEELGLNAVYASSGFFEIRGKDK